MGEEVGAEKNDKSVVTPLEQHIRLRQSGDFIPGNWQSRARNRGWGSVEARS
jgi:hypothetical protein